MATVEEICKQLGSDDQVEVYQARKALVELTSQLGAKGQDKQRAETARQLAAQLGAPKDPAQARDSRGEATEGSQLSAKARNYVARCLASIGGEPEVAALKQAFDDFDVREMARWALARMTCQGATDALVEAATKGIGEEFRIGAINALGCRPGSSGAAGALKTCASEASPMVRMAAVEALANHPDPAHDAVIEGALRGQGRGARRVAKARLRLAANLAKAGEKDAARKIYEAISDGNYGEAQEKAATVGLAELG
jgi:HEAT repeat protein